MSVFIPTEPLSTDPFKLYKEKCRTKIVNHSMLHRSDSYSFIEFKRDFFESAIDDLATQLRIVNSGIEEIAPRDRLLMELLKCYGFEESYEQAKHNKKLNVKYFPKSESVAK